MRYVLAFFILFLSYLYGFDLEYLEQINSKSAQGKFVQNKHLKHFNQVLKSSGEFGISNGELIWNITWPISQKSKITKDGIWVENSQKEWQKLDNNYDKELILSLITFDFDSLYEQFDITLNQHKERWELILKPKNIWLKKIFKQIVLNGKDRLEVMIFEETNGDKSINEFKFD